MPVYFGTQKKVLISVGGGADTSDATATADDILDGSIAYIAEGKVVGTMPNNGDVDVLLDTDVVSYTIPRGKHDGAGTVHINTQTQTITPSESQTHVSADSGKVLSSVIVQPIPSDYVGSGIQKQGFKIVTPTESVQTAVPSGVYTTDAIKVAAIESGYVGSDVPRKSSEHLNVEGKTITAPAGFYQQDASASVVDGSAGTPSASKSVSGTLATIIPSVTNSTGYITGGTKTGTAVTVDVTELATSRDETDLSASGDTVTVPAGYYAEQETKKVSGATQATPSISVSASGLITASATQSAGYVVSGTKSNTKQLTTQAAKTVTPTKSSQTAVAKDVYTTGVITVAAIPAEYIQTTDANATSHQIVNGATAYVNGVKVTGDLVTVTYRTGSGAPSDSLGSNGDLYFDIR